jgi:hypothetical protein
MHRCLVNHPLKPDGVDNKLNRMQDQESGCKQML